LNYNKNILICPLEWGLGHAARMIPMAKKLQEMNNNIFIGSGEVHLALFRSEMDGVTYIIFPGFRPGYSRHYPQYFIMLLKIPLLLYHIIAEHFRLKRIIRENKIDIVISDNRFGLWNKKIPSVYVTHLPLIPFPRALKLVETIGVLIHRFFINQYSYCFIPDLPGDLNVSGRLSHGVKLPDNVRFTGILSRFINLMESQKEEEADFKHNTVILSGPEPQRGMLRQKLVSILRIKEPPTVILEGRPDKDKGIVKSENIISYNHLSAPEMMMMIKGSESVISRSGYTTIMDLIALNCSALLIPTPGQTEQEYLAEYLSEKGWFTTIAQCELNNSLPLPARNAKWSEEIVKKSKILLESALEELLNKQHKKR
jgi:UDP:flavonoid glycosyltransferase YjiC (YdhE family)